MIMRVKYDGKEFTVRVAPEDVSTVKQFGRMQTRVGDKRVSIYPTETENRGEFIGGAIAFHLNMGGIQRGTSATVYFPESKMKRVE